MARENPWAARGKGKPKEWAQGFSPAHQTHVQHVLSAWAVQRNPSVLGLRLTHAPQHYGDRYQPSSASQHMLSHLMLCFSCHRTRAGQLTSSLLTQHTSAPTAPRQDSETHLVSIRHKKYISWSGNWQGQASRDIIWMPLPLNTICWQASLCLELATLFKE